MSCASVPAINEKPSSPPPEKTTARQDQTRQSSTGDGAWDGSRIIRMVMVVMLVAGDGEW
jgi:hypothetical protein